MNRQEAINIVKKNWPDSSFTLLKEALEFLIPELMNTDDEKIKEAIIKGIIHAAEEGCFCADNYNVKECIAWLEKQNKQKSVNRIKAKFKAGDWITNGIDATFQVRSIEDNMYLRSDDYFIDIKTADKKFRLWTIKDAKNGDVLSYRNGQWFFIYKEKIDYSSFYYHILYSTIHQDLIIDNIGFTLLSDAITPATKEQCNLLFQKMHEAGYEWNVEKKELKKIDNKIEIPFGAKDSELQEATYYIPKGFHAEIEGKNVIIKKGEHNPAWSKEDEKEVAVLEAYIRSRDWSERHVDRALGIVDELVNKVKSIKSQFTWKPSDEQIMALRWVLNHIPYDSHKEEISGLLEQIKKLRKE